MSVVGLHFMFLFYKPFLVLCSCLLESSCPEAAVSLPTPPFSASSPPTPSTLELQSLCLSGWKRQPDTWQIRALRGRDLISPAVAPLSRVLR